MHPTAGASITLERTAEIEATRASDADRERTIALLTEHWLAGRLTLAELEARSEEVWRGRLVADLWHAMRQLPVARTGPAGAATAPSNPSEVVGLVLGLVGACVLLMSFGLLFLVSLPLSASAWVCGRGARRQADVAGAPRGTALAGETLGVVGTILGLLAVAGCAAIVTVA